MLTYLPAVPATNVLENKVLKATVDGMSVLLARDVDGQIFAFENNCSHADKPLERGVWNSQTREMLCPFHKAVFDVGRGGAVVTGPAVVALQVYPVQIRSKDGVETVFVGLNLED